MGSAQGKQNEDVMGCAYNGAAERVWMKRGGNIADMYAGGCDTCGGVADDGSYLGGGGSGGMGKRSTTGKFIGRADINLDSVKDYASSVNSAAKSSIVKELIEVGRGLGLLKSTTSEDPSEQLRAMAKAIPAIKSDAKVHAETCKRLAMAINSVYGNKIIDAALPADVVCQQVVEILLSLTRGMHSEFLMVYEDAKRIIANLHVLKQALEADRAAILDRVASSDDALLSGSLGSHTDLFKLLLEEVDRQIQLLENLLNVEIKPADKDLAQLLKHDADFAGLVDKIDVRVGSDKFGAIIRQVLSGLGVTANYALVIDNALKAVGMKMEEYAAMETVRDLRDKLTTKAALEGLDDDKLHKYLESAELLYKNLYRSKDIAAAKTGSGDMSGKEGADDNIADLYGGGNGFLVADGGNGFLVADGGNGFLVADGGNGFLVADGGKRGGNGFLVADGGDDEYRRSPIDKRVEDRKKLRTLIFNAFYRQINELFNSFIGTLDIMTMKVGTEIPLSEQLNGLRQSLSQVNERLVRNQQIYHALIGYYNDSMSKSKKEQLITELKSVLNSVDTILEMSMYSSSKSYFVNIKNSIEAMLNLIAKYSSEIASKFGGDSFIVADGGRKSGGSGFIVADGGDLYEPLTKMFVPAKNINDAIRQFDYKYREAKIRQNLELTKAELGKYAEKYEDLVAQSIADILRADKIVYDKLLDHIDDKLLDPADATTATKIADAKAFLRETWDCKQKFWATAEAVDAYMRVFTDGIVKDPNAVREIKAMLSEVEVINDWYSDATGNNIAAVFEHFPSEINAGARTMPPSVYATPDKDHPYTKIKDAAGKPGNAMPGNPYLVAMPGEGLKASARAKSALGGLSVLKNLLSVFSHIGSTFAGQDLAKQVFMRPTQMYNNLMEYMRCSAFAQGFGLDGCQIVDGDFTDVFYDGTNVTVSFDPLTGDSVSGIATALKTYDVDGSVHIGVDNSGAGLQRQSDRALETRILANINDNLVITPPPVNPAVDHVTAHGHTRLALPAKMTQAEKDKLFRKRWGVWMRSVMPSIKKREGFSFQREDEYFVLILKSIAAKILTVVGMYDVFDRPMEHNGLSPIRMIIGGSIDVPKVEAGATALYLRLPLLAQFYRGIFGYDETAAGANANNTYGQYNEMRLRDNANVKISMVPDVDGVFSGLIRFIFRKSKNIETPSYSDEDIKELVREVNLIYQKMVSKYPQDTTNKTINELVAEMNRRYAIVTKDERDKYETEFNKFDRFDYHKLTEDKYNRETDMPPTDYAILPGEGDEEVERKSAAQRLLGEGFTNDLKGKKNPFTITIQHKLLVDKFRCAIDKYFENASEEFSFDGAIRAAVAKLNHETNDDARLKVVASLVRGVDIYNSVDGMKFVLFEETVVGGLNMLSIFHSLLVRFKHIAQLIDVKEIERLLWVYLTGIAGNVPTTANFSNELFAHFTRDLKINLADPVYGGLLASLTDFNPAALGHLTAGGVLNPAGNVVSADAVKAFARAYANPADANHGHATEFMQEFLDNQVIFRTIIETIGGISNDFQGLLGVRVEDGRITANTAGLRGLVEEMFGHVSYFIDLLRPHVSQEIMAKYTDKLTAGSYYWLQEQLMEKIFVGRPEQAPNALRYQSLDAIFQRLSYAYSVVIVSVGASDARHYGQLFASFIFYDAAENNSGVISNGNPLVINPSANAIDGVRFSGLPAKRVLDTRFAARHPGLYADGPEFNNNRSLLFSFNQLVAKYLQSFFDPITGKIYLGIINQFALGSFNQAIANPEYTYPDTIPMVALGTNGINSVSGVMKADDFGLNAPLFDGSLPAGINLIIAASDSNAAILPAIRRVVNNQQNIAASVAFGSRADPDAGHILFTSLAMLLKNMLTNKTENAGLAHVHENIADVPVHIKEKMRANLPAFKNLFRGLVARAEGIKKFATGANLERHLAAGDGLANPWPAKLLAVVTASSVAKDRFVGIIDAIVSGCMSLITCCENSLREVGDDAKYFETYNGSIRDYTSQYNMAPFMPLSSTLSVFRNLDNTNYMDMFPVHSLGNDNFKMMYGTRALIGGMTTAVLPEHVPGFTNIIDKYNLMSETKASADKARSNGFLVAYTKMLRFAFEARHIKGLLSLSVGAQANEGLFTKLDFTMARPAGDLNNTSEVSIVTGADNCGHDKYFASSAYAFSHSVSDIVRLTESSLQEEKIKEFVNHICASKKTTHSLELQNIVDLNIVPINVHALAREIPLINLYNYAYTFDRLIVELYYGLGDNATKDIMSKLCMPEFPVGSSKDMLVALLLNPYRDLYSGMESGVVPVNADINMYDKYAKGMLLGQVDNSELGRPKFLSDQIYNKVVFGSVYDDTDTMDELGPIADVIRAGSITMDQAVKFATALIKSIVRPYIITANPKISVIDFTFAIQAFIVYMMKQGHKEPNHNAQIALLDAGKPILTNILTSTALFYKPIAECVNKLNKGQKPSDAIATLYKDLVKVADIEINRIAMATGDVYVVTTDGINLAVASTLVTVGVRQYQTNDDVQRKLQWLSNNAIQSADIPRGLYDVLNRVGRLRFDTIFVRNLIFITNLYRSVRMKLARDLTYNKDVIARSLPITNNNITEFYGNGSDSSRNQYNHKRTGR